MFCRASNEDVLPRFERRGSCRASNEEVRAALRTKRFVPRFETKSSLQCGSTGRTHVGNDNDLFLWGKALPRAQHCRELSIAASSALPRARHCRELGIAASSALPAIRLVRVAADSRELDVRMPDNSKLMHANKMEDEISSVSLCC
jgi:hypothetical protein